MKSLANDFPKFIVDQCSETRSELLKQWPQGEDALDKFIHKKINSGEWERVKKRIGGKLHSAYRRAKQ